MRAYLLDCNHVDAIFHDHNGCRGRFERIDPQSPARISVITLGEVEAGMRMTGYAGAEEYLRFVHQSLLPWTIEVGRGTWLKYADIMDGIWVNHRPRVGVKTERHLVDLGVDVNDVWTAAVALEHGLTLLTQDKMAAIKEAAPDLDTECWL